jgi:hypothetical protein
MRTYILKRLIQIVPTVLMITFVVFVMMRSVPGDPVVSVLGDAYTGGCDQGARVRSQQTIVRAHLARQAGTGDWGSIPSPGARCSERAHPPAGHARLIVLSMFGPGHRDTTGHHRALRQNTWADCSATTVA